MQQYIGEEFDGVVSGVAHFGFWVETVDTKCEGLVSIHNMTTKDEFKYDENEYALIGLFTGRKIRIGDKVRIQVVAANLGKRQLDYDLVEEGGGEPGPLKKSGRKPATTDRPARKSAAADKKETKTKGKKKDTTSKKKPASAKRQASSSRKKP
jgi:ribonuclease R